MVFKLDHNHYTKWQIVTLTKHDIMRSNYYHYRDIAPGKQSTPFISFLPIIISSLLASFNWNVCIVNSPLLFLNLLTVIREPCHSGRLKKNFLSFRF